MKVIKNKYKPKSGVSLQQGEILLEILTSICENSSDVPIWEDQKPFSHAAAANGGRKSKGFEDLS